MAFVWFENFLSINSELPDAFIDADKDQPSGSTEYINQIYG